MNKDVIEVLKTAQNEIQSLRRVNEIQSARLGVFDSMMSIINAEPPNRMGFCHSPDIVHDIEKAIAVLEDTKSN